MMSACDAQTIDSLREYGRSIGMAFQIVDDILDFCGTEEQLGKPVGGDLSAGTLTLPAIVLMEDDPENNPINRFLDSKDDADRAEFLEAALDAARQESIVERCMETVEEWRDRGLAALHAAPTSGPREQLTAIAEFVTQRDF